MRTTKINIVTVNSGWILQKIAERIHDELKNLCESSISHEPDETADANFYVDVQNCFFGPTKTFDIGYFTHVHENNPQWINPTWFQLDYIMHMCTRYYDMFSNHYPKEKMQVEYQGQTDSAFTLKKPVLGVFQRGGFEGKGEGVMHNLISRPCMKNYKLLFVGGGWENVMRACEQAGVEAEHVTDESYENYPAHYDRIDYLLIPSLWEGGPMSVIEACAKGIPIIGSNVGVIGKDLEIDYMYEPGDINALEGILDSIMEEPLKRRKKVAGLSWKKYAETLLQVVENNI